MSAVTTRELSLRRANEIRSGRALRRSALAQMTRHGSREVAASYLEDTPPELESATAYWLLLSVRFVGETAAERMLIGAGVTHSRRLGELTDRQRRALAERLRAR